MPEGSAEGTIEERELRDKEAFAAALTQTYEPTEIVRALIEMGLRPSDLALVLDVHPRTINAWLDESDPRTAERQRDAILAVKSLVVFLLRRGALTPRQLALWLIEPNEKLNFRRPLAALGDGDINENLLWVMKAATPFLDPELGVPSEAPHPRVAAGAVNREEPRSRAVKAEEADAPAKAADLRRGEHLDPPEEL
jgi:hypothetical protein